jgi:hypothetical protein
MTHTELLCRLRIWAVQAVICFPVLIIALRWHCQKNQMVGADQPGTDR